MKRPALIVLLAAVVVLAGWAVAQPPASDNPSPPPPPRSGEGGQNRGLAPPLLAGEGVGGRGLQLAPEGQGPTVRLKRKKRPAQAEPPPKPDKVEKPDPAEGPKKKPDDPPRPKLDEEERLDPKDDLKLPAEEPRDEQEILARVARNARISEERITNRELGESTRTVQQEILKDIDSLIERANNQDDQNDQNDQNNQGKQGEPGGPGASGSRKEQRWVSQRRLRRQNARRNDRSRQGNDIARKPKPNQSEGNGDNPGGGGSSATANKDKLPDRAFDRWGHLPEKERALMQKEMEQKFMDKYDDLTKQYYRIIAEKSRRKK